MQNINNLKFSFQIKMKILFFDLETSGIPERNSPYNIIQKYDNARILQIYFCVYEIITLKNYKKIFEYDSYVDVDFEIKNSDIHGITKEISKGGKKIEIIINEITEHFLNTDIIVSHNIDFDMNILKSEFYRALKIIRLENINKKQTFCTMKEMKNIIKLPGKYDFKYPSLEELYFFLFNKKISRQKHSAIEDTNILVQCFFEMLKKGFCNLS